MVPNLLGSLPQVERLSSNGSEPVKPVVPNLLGSLPPQLTLDGSSWPYTFVLLLSSSGSLSFGVVTPS